MIKYNFVVLNTFDMHQTFFAPQLYIPNGMRSTRFYQEAFNAAELRQWMNDDGSYHVAELSINGTIFHLHEQNPAKGQSCPDLVKSTTVMIGLFVPDVDAVMKNAVAAGATIISPAQDYEYGYRQGEIKDPYGHQWLIQKKI